MTHSGLSGILMQAFVQAVVYMINGQLAEVRHPAEYWEHVGT